MTDTTQNTKQVQNSLPNQATDSQTPANKPHILDTKLGIIIGVIFAVIVFGVLVLIAKNAREKPAPPAVPEEENVVVAPIVPGITPPPIPQVKDEDKKAALEEYFKRVSPANYKSEYMAKVPDAAANAYIEFTKAQDKESKTEHGLAFIIYLNAPSVDKSDPVFVKFLQDVKGDIDKTLATTP